MKTPVALFIFNRLDTTKEVFAEIRAAQPPKLLVIADGPRPDRLGEDRECAATRSIIEQVDWECQVLTKYSDINLGCRKSVSSGLDWVFSHVEEAIILEDDCVPHSTFFRFCEELLERYRYNEKIMSINGSNVQFGRRRNHYSYYFSRYFFCWGWATWRRAWQKYDVTMQQWDKLRDSDFLKGILKDYRAVKYWDKFFQLTYENKKNTWAYQMLFTCWVNQGFNIVPNVNLVSNIGFGKEATNTQNKPETSLYSAQSTSAIEFPLKHPPTIAYNSQADDFTQKTLFNPSLLTRIIMKFNRILGIKRI